MNDYIELRIYATPCSEEITDLLAAFLVDEGYESFIPDTEGLTAFVRSETFSAERVKSVIENFPIPIDLSFKSNLVVGQDWNEEWYENYFKPIVIAGKCVVHSTFHTDVPHAEYDIVIDPRMAFGTGHHSTTNLMMSYLIDIDLMGKRVYDVGAGTAILSILAYKRGAGKVTGIEIDPPAWENAIDNIRLNNAEMDMLLGDATLLPSGEEADVLMANINRNIIVADLPRYTAAVKPGGTVLLSGFYEEDIPVVADVAMSLGLELKETRSDLGWVAVRFVKKSHV